MRTSGGKAAPSSRWPEVLFRVLAFSVPLLLLPLEAAMAASEQPALDARTLLTLGINLGIIAFAVGTAIACLRATERARKAEAEAQVEAERYRLSESTLETLLAAEPQALLTVAESGEAELLVATLPPALGVPRDTERAPQFRRMARRKLRPRARRCHRRAGRAQGEPFNLMLRTHATDMSRSTAAPPAGPSCSRCATWPGSGSSLADLAARHRQLEEQVASLRGLLDEASNAERGHAETKPSLETRFRSFDRLATAFAVFDAEQRLTHFNQAYVELWQLDPEWLATHPRDGEILDRLRQARRLPEKADYRQWKKELARLLRLERPSRGPMAPARRPHPACRRRQRGRGRRDLSLRERHRAARRSKAATTR